MCDVSDNDDNDDGCCFARNRSRARIQLLLLQTTSNNRRLSSLRDKERERERERIGECRGSPFGWLLEESSVESRWRVWRMTSLYLAQGYSKWISCAPSRLDVHTLGNVACDYGISVVTSARSPPPPPSTGYHWRTWLVLTNWLLTSWFLTIWRSIGKMINQWDVNKEGNALARWWETKGCRFKSLCLPMIFLAKSQWKCTCESSPSCINVLIAELIVSCTHVADVSEFESRSLKKYLKLFLNWTCMTLKYFLFASETLHRKKEIATFKIFSWTKVGIELSWCPWLHRVKKN